MRTLSLRKYPALLTVFLLLQSCSIFKASTSSSLTLPQPMAVAESGFALEQLQASPQVYSLRDSAGSTIYLTGLRDCGRTKERTSAAATTRQLIVGLENLRILNQQPTRVAESDVLVSSIHASLEQTPLRIECYTLRQGKCTFDVVAWNRAEGSKTSTYPFFPPALAYLQQALPGLTQ